MYTNHSCLPLHLVMSHLQPIALPLLKWDAWSSVLHMQPQSVHDSVQQHILIECIFCLSWYLWRLHKIMNNHHTFFLFWMLNKHKRIHKSYLYNFLWICNTCNPSMIGTMHGLCQGPFTLEFSQPYLFHTCCKKKKNIAQKIWSDISAQVCILSNHIVQFITISKLWPILVFQQSCSIWVFQHSCSIQHAISISKVLILLKHSTNCCVLKQSSKYFQHPYNLPRPSPPSHQLRNVALEKRLG